MSNGGSTDMNSSEDFDAVSILDYGTLELASFDKLEEELAVYEKISLLFLLYDHCEDSISLAKSILLDDSQQFLRNWAESLDDLHWKETLVEALLIIKNYQILHNLNIKVEHAKSHFMPHVVEISLFVHPMRKILYAMCEDFDKATTTKFIHSVLDSIDTSLTFKIDSNDYDYLELFLLKLISSNIVQIGSWTPLQNKLDNYIQCDAKTVTTFLQSKFINMHSKFVNVQEYINRQIHMKKHIFTPKLTEVTTTNETINRLDFENSYPIKNPKYVGDFVIISNKHFEETDLKLAERRGTENDVKELTTCWEAFGFKIHPYEDLNHNEISRIIRTHVNTASVDHGAFAVCILTHGTRGKIYGSDSVPIRVNEIKDILCQSEILVGKPKLLIIQACRGDAIMNTAHISSNEYTDNYIEIESDGLVNPPYLHQIPEKADLLVFWATVENFVSFRNVKDGTWFIQELCVWMMKYGDKQHLSDVFTIVTAELSKKGHQVCQMETTLRKKLWLWKIANEE